MAQTETDANQKPLYRRFQDLDNRRNNKMIRARQAAALTIPSLLPDKGITGQDGLPVPYSSMASKGPISLASRITANVYPINGQPFYGFDTSAIQASPDATPQGVIQIKLKIAEAEKRIRQSFDTSNYRQVLNAVALHLVVLGDCVLEQNDDGQFSIHRLDNFVVERDPGGKLRTVIIREWYDTDLLPDELSAIPKTHSQVTVFGLKNLQPHFTKVCLQKDSDPPTWQVYKEFRGTLYQKDKKYVGTTPYVVCQYQHSVGQDYSRSLCEENIGQLRTVDALSKCLLEMVAANAQYRMGVNPQGSTDVDDLAKSENGDFVPAREQDVFAIKADLGSQIQYTFQALMAREKNLGQIFLMDSVVQPQQERVTAFQSRVFAQQVQSTLGGPISAFYKTLQQPVIRRRIAIMKKNGTLPPAITKLVDGSILKIKMRTGLQALNREVQYYQMKDLLQAMSQMPPEAFEPVKWPSFLKMMWINSGVDSSDLLYTAQQVQDNRNKKAMRDVAAQGATDVIKAQAANAAQPPQA